MRPIATEHPARPRGLPEPIRAVLDAALPPPLVALALRLGIAAPFFMSGRAKVDGLLTLNETTFFLFREDFRLPLLPPDLVAYMATYAEHLFPLLIVLGLGTRVSALALLTMTLVIQIFVVPTGWPTHLLWLGPLLYLLANGPGRFSLDRLFRLD
ncbi:DoxX family protein [Brevundimonas sp.]|uniref:DoxX family protein n=1 Tax=Brevundimonas sp. TaxID=1871086 RepID=UPI002737C152|nr:DoxX family protein [Brevundimonas sp.]MDP3802382.1 DoxX family protein [Brevundimonas sp.]